MRSRVFRASFLISIIVCFLTMLMTSVILFRTMEDQAFSELEEEADLLSSVADEPEMLSEIQSAHRITLIDAGGRVLYDNQADAGSMGNHRSRQEVADALKSGSGKSIRNSDTMMTETLYYAKRLDNGNVLRVAENQDSIWAVFRGLARPAVILFMCAVLLSLFLSGRVTDKILQPINTIDLDHPEASDTYEEIRPLITRINEQQSQILEQQRNEMQKEEAYRREYTANVSHELKTPLTSISGFAELMMNGGVPEETVKDFSATIYNEAGRLITLVNDIIQLSQLDDETVQYTWSSVDLYELSGSILEQLRPAAEQRGIRLSLSGTHARAECVEKVMTEILYNVVDNAVKYNKKKGSVTVSVADEPDDVRISVKDTGVGIPKEDIPRIFERFYRVDKSHSREIGGTGLGLSIVKHGAKLHHMDIRVESEPGRGTEVLMRLPHEHEA